MNKFGDFRFKNVFNTKLLMMLPFFIISLILIVIPTIIIVVYAFIPHYNLGESANWKIMNLTTWEIIGWTLLTSFLTTLICILIGFPFAYLLSMHKTKVFKAFSLLVITSPIWSSTLFKLIGLRTMFDILNGAINSTYGDQYTILGYVYIFLPLMILPIYQILDGMPSNYRLASQDLGAGKIKTFFLVILPYAKNAVISGITLVFIPSMMIISVTAYMNNAANSQLLGGEIYSQGQLGLDNKLSLSRASVISIVSALILLILWFLIVKVPKWINFFFRYIQAKNSQNKYYQYSYNVSLKKYKKKTINPKLTRKKLVYEDIEYANWFTDLKKLIIVDEEIFDELDFSEENSYHDNLSSYKSDEMINQILDPSDINIKE